MPFDKGSGQMKITEYSPKYAEDVKDLLVELEEYLISIDEDGLDTLSADYREKYFENMLKEVGENSGKVFLALEEERAVGFIAGALEKYCEADKLDYKCPKKGRISELVVTHNARSAGIGKALVKKLEDYFKSAGCEYVAVEAFAYNKPALGFYGKGGYHTRTENMIKKL